LGQTYILVSFYSHTMCDQFLLKPQQIVHANYVKVNNISTRDMFCNSVIIAKQSKVEVLWDFSFVMWYPKCNFTFLLLKSDIQEGDYHTKNWKFSELLVTTSAPLFHQKLQKYFTSSFHSKVSLCQEVTLSFLRNIKNG
jgi:hypothetical protein